MHRQKKNEKKLSIRLLCLFAVFMGTGSLVQQLMLSERWLFVSSSAADADGVLRRNLSSLFEEPDLQMEQRQRRLATKVAGMWKNRHDLVHVIETRFMQNQVRVLRADWRLEHFDPALTLFS